MNRKRLPGLLPWLGLAATNLAMAWQPPKAEAIAGMLPPAPPGYQVQVYPMETQELVVVTAEYSSLSNNQEDIQLTVIGQAGPIESPPPTSWRATARRALQAYCLYAARGGSPGFSGGQVCWR